MSSSDEKTPAAELRRSLALLWGAPAEPTRGPKPGLTVPRIVAAAIELADAEGLAALSMRNLATALDVGTMTLYRYVPGRAELVALMVDEVTRPGELPDPAAGWRARVSAAAHGEWALYRRHPWVLHIAQGRPMLGPNAMDATEIALRNFADTGLSPREMIAAVMTISSFVAGLARTALEATQAAGTTGISDEEWWAAHSDHLVTVLAENRHPLLTTVGEAGAWEESATAEYLEFGLARILDGLEAAISARARP